VNDPTQIKGVSPTAPVGTEELSPGTMVGEYKIESRLGQGGMGTVYAARHPVIGKRVAIKVLSLFFSRDAGLVRRFTDEARSVNKIGHPNIIDVFAFGQLADGRQYFVMEYLEGETMAAWLEHGWPPMNEARRFLLQTCEALEAAHREGIIHRDLKPENLWIARPKHGEPYIKVLDFGLAKLIAPETDHSTTKTGMVMGTPQFMSPEQCTGRGVDHRTDIYAMGAIIFRVYCGRLAFDGGSSAEVIAAQLYQPPPKPSSLASMSEALEKLIFDCLDKDPSRRPASAAELGMRFKQATELIGNVTEQMAPVITAPPPAPETQKGFATQRSSLHKKQPAAKRRPRMLYGVVLLVLLVGALVALLGRGSRTSPAHETAAKQTVPAPQPPSTPVPPSTPPPPPAQEPASPPPQAPVASPPSPQPRHPAPATKKPAPPREAPTPSRKPSRIQREGLIQENPFQ
jgi:eukaryotic-like serine/threonine-protein kinase